MSEARRIMESSRLAMAGTEDVSIYRVIGARAPKRPSARARGRTIET